MLLQSVVKRRKKLDLLDRIYTPLLSYHQLSNGDDLPNPFLRYLAICRWQEFRRFHVPTRGVASLT